MTPPVTDDRTGPADPAGGPSPELDRRLALLLALAAVATGTALVVHVLLDVSLLLAALALVTGTAAMAAVVWSRLDPAGRADVRRRVWVGLVAGVVATAAYDLGRFVLVAVLSLSFKPFDVFKLFGQLLVGVDAPLGAVYAAGWTFHIVNGLGFAIAYTIVVRRPKVWSAVVWAFVLEACMALLYPSWLRIQALSEFYEVSVLGHALFGIGLGLTAKRMLRDGASTAQRGEVGTTP
ncbi:MAG: hypothetical protein U0Q07_19655 [Acidimicrobiales bacterium]